MDDEARPGSTPVTLPQHVAERRSRGVELAIVGGLVGFGAIFGAVKARASEAIDAALTLRWQSVRHPVVARVMELVSWPGFPPQSRVIPLVITAVMLVLRLPLEAAFQFLAWGTGGLSSALKSLMLRPRPVAGKDLRVVAAPLGGSSFPSGHVITYVGTYGWLVYVVHTRLRLRWLRRLVVGGLVGLIALVGPSRIYQGHHWPTDVAASYLLGTSYLVGLVSLYQWIRRKQRSARTAPE